MKRRLWFWTLIAALALVMVIWHSLRSSPHFPSWGQLPPPTTLATAFGAKPVGLGVGIPAACVPTPVWSGADEALLSSAGLIVAYDGEGVSTRPAHISVHETSVRGVSWLQVGSESALQVIWRVPGGWVAVAVWQTPSSLVPKVAERLQALALAAGTPLPTIPYHAPLPLAGVPCRV